MNIFVEHTYLYLVYDWLIPLIKLSVVHNKQPLGSKQTYARYFSRSFIALRQYTDDNSI